MKDDPINHPLEDVCLSNERDGEGDRDVERDGGRERERKRDREVETH